MVYALDEQRRDELVPRARDCLRELPGVDLAVSMEGDAAHVWSRRGELRFAPGGELEDRRGGRWRVEGELAALELEAEGGGVGSHAYPDALPRLWSALACVQSGDVLASGTPGYEFADWGGADHVGGGSHGSLHRDDSEGVLLAAGLALPERASWSLADVTPLILDHFSVPWER